MSSTEKWTLATATLPFTPLGQGMEDLEKTALDLALAQADQYGATQKLNAAQKGLGTAKTPAQKKFTDEINAMQTRIAEMTPKIAQLEKQLGIEPSGAAKAATKLLDEQKPLPKPAEEEKPPSAALTAALESLSKLTQQALDKSKETKAERTISRYRIRGGWCRRRHQRRSQHNPPIDLAAPLVSASRHRDHDRCSDGSPRARLWCRLESASANFAAAFGTAAASLTAAGQSIITAGATAASTITSAMPGVGAALGQAAAAATRSAVSGITVNVNANVVGGA